MLTLLLKSACLEVCYRLLLQIRIQSRPEMESQTQYALEFAGKVYTYFKDYFQIAEVVPKAGDCLGVTSLDADATMPMTRWLHHQTSKLLLF